MHCPFKFPGSKVHGATMGPSWVLSAPDGPHVGPWTLLSGLLWTTPNYIDTSVNHYNNDCVQWTYRCFLTQYTLIYIWHWTQKNPITVQLDVVVLEICVHQNMTCLNTKRQTKTDGGQLSHDQAVVIQPGSPCPPIVVDCSWQYVMIFSSHAMLYYWYTLASRQLMMTNKHQLCFNPCRDECMYLRKHEKL